MSLNVTVIVADFVMASICNTDMKAVMRETIIRETIIIYCGL